MGKSPMHHHLEKSCISYPTSEVKKGLYSVVAINVLAKKLSNPTWGVGEPLLSPSLDQFGDSSSSPLLSPLNSSPFSFFRRSFSGLFSSYPWLSLSKRGFGVGGGGESWTGYCVLYGLLASAGRLNVFYEREQKLAPEIKKAGSVFEVPWTRSLSRLRVFPQPAV